MAVLGTYSVSGSFSSTTLSREYSTVDELLQGLFDNQAQAINAVNIRDVAYTLWERISAVAASASMTFSVDYNRPAFTTVGVGGISAGSTFSGSIQDALDRIFYPYSAPGASLTSWSQKEYGDTSGYTFALSYSATVNSNPLTSIVVNGTSKPLSPLSGTEPASSTHSSVNPSSNPGTQQTYSMTVSDGTSATVASTTVSWRNKIYWGRVNLSSIGHPNLTTNPGSASLVGTLITSSLILGLNGAGANGAAFGNILSTTKTRTYSNINGNNGLIGNHLIFAWPSNMSTAYTPIFTVNGLLSSAFTRVKTNWQFTNSYGFNGSDYEVWVSNTVQNSPLNIVIT